MTQPLGVISRFSQATRTLGSGDASNHAVSLLTVAKQSHAYYVP